MYNITERVFHLVNNKGEFALYFFFSYSSWNSLLRVWGECGRGRATERAVVTVYHNSGRQGVRGMNEKKNLVKIYCYALYIVVTDVARYTIYAMLVYFWVFQFCRHCVSFFLTMLCYALLLLVFFFIYFKFCQEHIFHLRHIVAMCVYPEIDTILYLVWSQSIDWIERQSIWDHRYVNYSPQFCQLNTFNLSVCFGFIWILFHFIFFRCFPFIFRFKFTTS